MKIRLAPEAISAVFSREDADGRQTCRLSLQAKDGSLYDEIGADIEANVNACSLPMACPGIDTRFRIGHRVDGTFGKLLTSATISDIPSYNRLPDGFGYTTIRGQFGAANADKLVDELQKESFNLQYSINFDEATFSHEIPTQKIKRPVADFLSCTVGADFRWSRHMLDRRRQSPCCTNAPGGEAFMAKSGSARAGEKPTPPPEAQDCSASRSR
jgi:hypothetical protein